MIKTLTVIAAMLAIALQYTEARVQCSDGPGWACFPSDNHRNEGCRAKGKDYHGKNYCSRIKKGGSCYCCGPKLAQGCPNDKDTFNAKCKDVVNKGHDGKKEVIQKCWPEKKARDEICPSFKMDKYNNCDKAFGACYCCSRSKMPDCKKA